jgi:hypothetical protein
MPKRSKQASNPKPRNAAAETPKPTSLELQERRFTAEGSPPPGLVGNAVPDSDTEHVIPAPTGPKDGA